jgi:hypothetical protein
MIELTSETSDPKQRNNSQIICFLKKGKGKEQHNVQIIVAIRSNQAARELPSRAQPPFSHVTE